MSHWLDKTLTVPPSSLWWFPWRWVYGNRRPWAKFPMASQLRQCRMVTTHTNTVGGSRLAARNGKSGLYGGGEYGFLGREYLIKKTFRNNLPQVDLDFISEKSRGLTFHPKFPSRLGPDSDRWPKKPPRRPHRRGTPGSTGRDFFCCRLRLCEQAENLWECVVNEDFCTLWFMYRFKYYKYIHIINTHILIFARWVKWIQTIHESWFPSPASTPVPLVLGRQNSIVYYKILLASAHIVAVLAGWFYGCSPW